MEEKIQVKAFTKRTFIVLSLMVFILVVYTMNMGAANFFSTVMKTSHDLLLNTVFFIMALSVIAGAVGSFMAEFGVLALLNWLFAPAIRLFWGLPGAAALGALSTFISDNPAIIALGKDKDFIKYFKDYQKPALTNLGTSFGMGLIVMAYMISQNDSFFLPAIIGLLGAVLGSMVSTRIMLHFSIKALGVDNTESTANSMDYLKVREIRQGNLFQRFLEALLEGGKNGLQIGFEIIPGVLVICTLVLMMTLGPGDDGYTGAAYQGIAILPAIGRFFELPLRLLFGFEHPESISFPITSLGAVGAALALVPRLAKEGMLNLSDIAVFTAMGMCWSGYLSTHIAMMDVMGFKKLTSKALISHTIGGLCAGIFAHYLFLLSQLLF